MRVVLTQQQELFAREYVACKFNGSEAYRRAYPKVKSDATARANAARLLANANVAARVAEIAQAAASEQEITPARALRELAFIAFQRAGSIYRPDGTLKTPDEWDEATAATISGLESEEEWGPDGSEAEQEPQPHGGTLKRNRGKLRAVRTLKVKRWDKVKALELFMKHFGLLKEDAPHPDRPKFDLSRVPDEAKRALLDLLRAARQS